MMITNLLINQLKQSWLLEQLLFWISVVFIDENGCLCARSSSQHYSVRLRDNFRRSCIPGTGHILGTVIQLVPALNEKQFSPRLECGICIQNRPVNVGVRILIRTQTVFH